MLNGQSALLHSACRRNRDVPVSRAAVSNITESFARILNLTDGDEQPGYQSFPAVIAAAAACMPEFFKADDGGARSSSLNLQGHRGIHPAVARAIKPAYTAAGSRFASISEALRACSSLDLDFDAINCFLRTGFYLRGRTPFKQVRREWRPPPLVACRPRGRAEAIEEFVHTFHRAVGRMVRGNAILGLSGGADSRHILLELVKLDRPPNLALTIDLPGSEDADIARKLSARFGVSHKVVPPTDGLEDEILKCALVEFMSLQHRWFMAAVDQVTSPTCWWDGIGGDVLSAGLFLEPWSLRLMHAGQFEAYAERLVPPNDVYWFGPRAPFRREQAIFDIVEELKLHAAAANPIGSFYFWNRTCVDVAASPFGILAHQGVQVLAPYLDHEVWEYLMSLPASLLVDHQFHIEAIRAAHPAAADLPYASKRQLPAAVQRNRARSVLPMLWRRLLNEPRLVTLRALRHAACASITGQGHSGSIMETLVYANALRAALDRH